MSTSRYYLIDDYGTSAGPPGGGTGMASGEQLSPEFTANNDTDAGTIAHIFATTFQRPVRLVKKGTAPPYTLYVGQGANTALTVVPSGAGE